MLGVVGGCGVGARGTAGPLHHPVSQPIRVSVCPLSPRHPSPCKNNPLRKGGPRGGPRGGTEGGVSYVAMEAEGGIGGGWRQAENKTKNGGRKCAIYLQINDCRKMRRS